MAELNFDELNNINSLSTAEYFSSMEISESDKRRREELADLIDDVMLFFFSAYLVFTDKAKALYDRNYFVKMVYDRLEDAVMEVTGIDEYIKNRLQTISEEVVDTTINRLNKQSDALTPYESFETSPPSEEPLPPSGSSPEMGENADTYNTDLPYWLSEKRAFFIAVDTANTIMNYTDFTVAKAEGMTRKQWLTQRDEKVRVTHIALDGQTIGIDDVFVVGDSIMRFPKDEEYSPNPKETIRCRCSIRYLR